MDGDGWQGMPGPSLHSPLGTRGAMPGMTLGIDGGACGNGPEGDAPGQSGDSGYEPLLLTCKTATGGIKIDRWSSGAGGCPQKPSALGGGLYGASVAGQAAAVNNDQSGC